MKQLITTKQPAYLTHLRDEPNLSLAKEHDVTQANAGVNPKNVAKKTIKGKGTGKEATMKELEQVKKQRIAQKRFMKTEYVSKELMQLCYSLFEHLQKMRKCSYISESNKPGKYNTNVRVRYMTTKNGK